MRVLLVNQGHTDNLGDKAISYSISTLINRQFHASVDVLPFLPGEESGCLGDLKKSHDIDFANMQNFSSFYVRMKNRIRNFLNKFFLKSEYEKVIRDNLESSRKYDIAIIGGGELIKGGSHPFFAALCAWIDCLDMMQCPIIVMGVSCDSSFNKRQAKLLHNVLSKCSSVCVRDLSSFRVMKDLLGIDCQYIPDVVFAYRYLTEPHDVSSPKKHGTVAACVFSYSEFSGINQGEVLAAYYEKWFDLINSVSKCNQIVLAYTTYTDYCETVRFCRWLKSEKNLDAKVADISSIEDFISVISQCDEIISGRMHSMILALQYGAKLEVVTVKNKLAVFKDEWEGKRFDWKKEGEAIVLGYSRAIQKCLVN